MHVHMCPPRPPATHTGRTSGRGEGREWSDASTSQGMAKIASKSLEARQDSWN